MLCLRVACHGRTIATFGKNVQNEQSLPAVIKYVCCSLWIPSTQNWHFQQSQNLRKKSLGLEKFLNIFLEYRHLGFIYFISQASKYGYPYLLNLT